jgi:hypothetical protein
MGPTTKGGSGIMNAVATVAHVTLSGDIAGRYVVTGQRPDGELRLVPDTSAQAIRERGGSRRLTEGEWQDFLTEYGPHMGPPDGEG